MAAPLLLDVRDLGVNAKGVGRVLSELVPRLVELAPDRYHVVGTTAMRPLLPVMSQEQVHVVAKVPNSVWEQAVLPAVARRIRAGAAYAHRECGPLWGPPLLLHLTEDPEVRWRRHPPSHPRAAARRAYSRVFMARSLRRATVGASTATVADHVASAYGIERSRVDIIPLAVDHAVFRPVDAAPGCPSFFHLASGDPRDRTELVLDAFARFLATSPDPPRLVIGGDLGDAAAPLGERARRLGIDGLLDLTGRLTDEQLVQRYSGAIASIQPSSDEGFGLQPLEVLACGGLLIASREPSVMEVVDGACVSWCEPTEGSIAAAMSTAVTADLRARARAVNPGVARRFDWSTTAATVHERLLAMSGGAA